MYLSTGVYKRFSHGLVNEINNDYMGNMIYKFEQYENHNSKQWTVKRPIKYLKVSSSITPEDIQSWVEKGQVPDTQDVDTQYVDDVIAFL